MLQRRTWDLATLNPQFTALYNARVAGLRIEAQIQQVLNQISSDELKLLEVILDSPVTEDRLIEVAAYSMHLSVTEHTNATKKITESELKGPLVFTAAPALKSPASSAASYLVYWPGTGGALQRFASLQALQEALFNISPQDKQLALVLKELTGNPSNTASAFSKSISRSARRSCARPMPHWTMPKNWLQALRSYAKKPRKAPGARTRRP